MKKCPTPEEIDQIIELSRTRERLATLSAGLKSSVIAQLKFLFGGDYSKKWKELVKGELTESWVLGTSVPFQVGVYNQIRSEVRSIEKLIRNIVEDTEVWSDWAKHIPGVGSLGIGLILSCIGHPDDYSHKKKIFKRMGLGVIRGERQHRSKTDYEVQGYSTHRRTVSWKVSSAMFRNTDCPYRDIYHEAKEVEKTKSEKGAHRRALRKMEKEFLSDLWKVCRFGVGQARSVQVSVSHPNG